MAAVDCEVMKHAFKKSQSGKKKKKTSLYRCSREVHFFRGGKVADEVSVHCRQMVSMQDKIRKKNNLLLEMQFVI